MSEKDELAKLILNNFLPSETVGSSWRLRPFEAANDILAAGYRKPRTITTSEELDALPNGSIVRCEDGEGFGMNVAERKKAGWEYVGSSIMFQSFHLAADELPFTVLWEPK